MLEKYLMGLLYFLYLWITTTSESCVRIGQCDPLNWLLLNRERVRLPIEKISTTLADLNCGFEGREPKVKCNYTILDGDDREEEGIQFPEETELRSGVISGNRVQNRCSGSIMYYGLQDDGFSVSKISRRKRSITDSVYRVVVYGNCCWKLYEKSNFRGKSLIYTSGFDEEPDINVRSVRKWRCRR